MVEAKDITMKLADVEDTRAKKAYDKWEKLSNDD